MKTSIRVGLVQAESDPGHIAKNLEHATPLVEQAASQGAELVLLPELYACGYIPNQSIWQYAESRTGPSCSWLAQTAARLKTHLGMGYLETDGRHFYNSYALADDQGRLLGTIRKRQVESYCFRPGRGTVVIESRFGRLGIGICADNHRSNFPQLLHKQAADVLLMPHGAPAPCAADALISQADIERALAIGSRLAGIYTQSLGLPVLFVNAVGAMQPISGLLGTLMQPGRFRLRGHSCIVAADGSVLGQLGEDEAVLVAIVELAGEQPAWQPPADHGGWLQPGNPLVRKLIIPWDIFTGTLAYWLNPKRRRLARSAAATR